jgi:hypothetical protein
LAPEKIESDRRERTEKVNLVNAHPPLGHHPPIDIERAVIFPNRNGTPALFTQVIAYLGRKNMVIAACADASLRAWEMVNKTFKEAANGEKKGQVITIKPTPNGSCGPWASHNISHMDPYGFYTCWKCMYGISKLP